jgi:hypothetical protein
LSYSEEVWSSHTRTNMSFSFPVYFFYAGSDDMGCVLTAPDDQSLDLALSLQLIVFGTNFCLKSER